MHVRGVVIWFILIHETGGGLSENDRQARVDHIKKCAQIKKDFTLAMPKMFCTFSLCKKKITNVASSIK
jgi:hypothetical protein